MEQGPEEFQMESIEQREIAGRRQIVANRLFQNQNYIVDEGTVDKAIRDFDKLKHKARMKNKRNREKQKRAEMVANEMELVESSNDSLAVDSFTNNQGTNKSLNEDEDKLIEMAKAIRSRHHERESRKNSAYAMLTSKGPCADDPPEMGLKNFSDLHGAVHQGIAESCAASLMQLLNWDTPAVKKIGSLCKVYWDGEGEWFYARILNYDKQRDKHYIYYLSDNTAEWISLSSESVLVAEDMCLAKAGSTTTPWPSQRFWMSAQAAEDVKQLRGYRKDTHFVECFSETDTKEYIFVKEKQLFPLQDHIVPENKRTKKFAAAMQAALAEQEIIDSVIETIFKALRNFIFDALKGPDWIRIRIRASTHRINDDVDVERDDEQAYSLYSQPYKRRATLKTVDDDALGSDSVAKYYKGSAFCVGTVSQYCPSIDQHLVLFDELVLQPQWVSCNRSTVDLLAGYPASAAVLPPPRPKTLIFEEGEESIRANSICMVCELRLDADQLSCSTCARNCHRRCLPPLKFPAPVAPSMTPTVGRKKTNALRASALTTWTCWSCVACSVCKTSLWDQPLMWWNINRIQPPNVATSLGEQHDRSLLLCGLCLEKFKYHHSFCPICFVLYEDISTDSALIGNGVGQSPAAAGTVSKSGTNSSCGGEAVVDTDRMVQCNECFKWVHASCEGIDDAQYDAISLGTHPIWGDEYLCPWCRVKLATHIISKLREHDPTFLFAEPVTTLVAKNYFDVIRNPMDLSSMAAKSTRGQYKSLQALRQDFELMCLNALVFNKTGDEYWTEAKAFYLRGKRLFEMQSRKSHPSVYTAEIEQIVGFNAGGTATIGTVSNVTASGLGEGDVGAKARRGKKRKTEVASVSLKDTFFDESALAVATTDPSLTDPTDIKETGNASTNDSSKDGDPTNTMTIASDVLAPKDVTFPPNSDIAAVSTVELAASEAPAASTAESISQNGTTVLATNEELVLVEEQATPPFRLPVALVPAPDPRSCITIPILIPSYDEVFYSMAQDICSLCASAGSTAFLLFCRDCGEAFHSFCVDVPLALLNEQEKRLWRCSNCKICMHCGLATEDVTSETGRMVYCDRCDDAFHMSCLMPALATLPAANEAWYCANCVVCEECDPLRPDESSHAAAWGTSMALCSLCQGTREERRKIVGDVMEELLSLCERQESKDTEMFQYWPDSSEAGPNSKTLSLPTKSSVVISTTKDDAGVEKSSATIGKIAPILKEQPNISSSSTGDLIGPPTQVENTQVKRARQKKLKVEKQFEDMLSAAMEMSEHAERAAHRSEVIAEFESPGMASASNQQVILHGNRQGQQLGEIQKLFCAGCRQTCSSLVDLTCTECKSVYHSQCRLGSLLLPSAFLPIAREKTVGGTKSFICRNCFAEKRKYAVLDSESIIAASVALAVVEVQQARLQKKRDLDRRKQQEASEAMEKTWQTERLAYEGVILWSAIRYTWLKSVDNLTASSSFANFMQREQNDDPFLVREGDEVLPAWMRHRAVRFLVIWRRKQSKVRLEWETRRRINVAGLHSNETGLPIPEAEKGSAHLARLAAGAAAFLYCTAPDIPPKKRSDELIEVAKYVLKSAGEDLRSPDEAIKKQTDAIATIKTFASSLLCPPIGFRDQRLDVVSVEDVNFQSPPSQQPRTSISSSSNHSTAFSTSKLPPPPAALPDALLHRSNLSSRATDAAQRSKQVAATALVRAQEACVWRREVQQAEMELEKAIEANRIQQKMLEQQKNKRKAPNRRKNLPSSSLSFMPSNKNSSGAEGTKTMEDYPSHSAATFTFFGDAGLDFISDRFVSVCMDCGDGHYARKARMQVKGGTVEGESDQGRDDKELKEKEFGKEKERKGLYLALEAVVAEAREDAMKQIEARRNVSQNVSQASDENKVNKSAIEDATQDRTSNETLPISNIVGLADESSKVSSQVEVESKSESGVVDLATSETEKMATEDFRASLVMTTAAKGGAENDETKSEVIVEVGDESIDTSAATEIELFEIATESRKQAIAEMGEAGEDSNGSSFGKESTTVTRITPTTQSSDMSAEATNRLPSENINQGGYDVKNNTGTVEDFLAVDMAERSISNVSDRIAVDSISVGEIVESGKTTISHNIECDEILVDSGEKMEVELDLDEQSSDSGPRPEGSNAWLLKGYSGGGGGYSSEEPFQSVAYFDVSKSEVQSFTSNSLPYFSNPSETVASQTAMASRLSWLDPRYCCMCRDGQEDSVVGRLMTLSSGNHVHLNCLRWSCPLETSGGLLPAAREAVERAAKSICFLCKQRGAGVTCMSRKCKSGFGKVLKCRHSFHLRCALSCGMLLLETARKTGREKGGDDNSNNEVQSQGSFDVHLLTVCPEHVLTNIPLQKLSDYKCWSPMKGSFVGNADDGVRRCLLLPSDVMFLERANGANSDLAAATAPVAELLAQRRGDKCLRIGSLSVLHLGSIPLQKQLREACEEETTAAPAGRNVCCPRGLYNESYIYPHRFRSARIGWSMVRPGQRTVHCFEVFLQSDFDSKPQEALVNIAESIQLCQQLEKCFVSIASRTAGIESEKEGNAEEKRNALQLLERQAIRILELLTGIEAGSDPDDDNSLWRFSDEEIAFIAQSHCCQTQTQPQPAGGVEGAVSVPVSEKTSNLDVVEDFNSALPANQDADSNLSFHESRDLNEEKLPITSVDADIASAARKEEDPVAIDDNWNGNNDRQVVFRMVSMDNPNYAIYSSDIYILYDVFRWAAYRTNSSDRWCDQGQSKGKVSKDSRVWRERKDARGVFGLNAHQFFGIGVPVVRQAIEFMLESVAVMVDLTPTAVKDHTSDVQLKSTSIAIKQEKVEVQEDIVHVLKGTNFKSDNSLVSPGPLLYKPSYRLPNAADITRVLDKLEQSSQNFSSNPFGGLGGRGRPTGRNSSSSSNSSITMSNRGLRRIGGGSDSLLGCGRAEEVQPIGILEDSDPSKSRVLTRILTKMVDKEKPLNDHSSIAGVPAELGMDAEDEELLYNQQQQQEQQELRRQEQQEEELEASQRDAEKYCEMSIAYLQQPDLKLQVRRSGIHGWGLFARTSFEKNEVIVEYIGQKIRQLVADRREGAYERDGLGSCYLFRLDKDDIIDATRTGGMARFINHCCEPNAYAKVISTDKATLQSYRGLGLGLGLGVNGANVLAEAVLGLSEGKHITIMAARDIQEGEEITYDYKFPIEDKKLKCYCGAKSCQGSMN